MLVLCGRVARISENVARRSRKPIVVLLYIRSLACWVSHHHLSTVAIIEITHVCRNRAGLVPRLVVLVWVGARGVMRRVLGTRDVRMRQGGIPPVGVGVAVVRRWRVA